MWCSLSSSIISIRRPLIYISSLCAVLCCVLYKYYKLYIHEQMMTTMPLNILYSPSLVISLISLNNSGCLYSLLLLLVPLPAVYVCVSVLHNRISFIIDDDDRMLFAAFAISPKWTFTSQSDNSLQGEEMAAGCWDWFRCRPHRLVFLWLTKLFHCRCGSSRVYYDCF